MRRAWLHRRRRAVLHVPAGNDPDIDLTTENDGPLLTETAFGSSRDVGTVLETEADHA